MKIIILCVALSSLLTGCGTASDHNVIDDRALVRIWVDQSTGCEYLISTGYGGINARMNSNGNQICEGKRVPHG